MNEEGAIKFNCTWISSEPIDIALLQEINECRNLLFREKLIGVNHDGLHLAVTATKRFRY